MQTCVVNDGLICKEKIAILVSLSNQLVGLNSITMQNQFAMKNDLIITLCIPFNLNCITFLTVKQGCSIDPLENCENIKRLES